MGSVSSSQHVALLQIATPLEEDNVVIVVRPGVYVGASLAWKVSASLPAVGFCVAALGLALILWRWGAGVTLTYRR